MFNNMIVDHFIHLLYNSSRKPVNRAIGKIPFSKTIPIMLPPRYWSLLLTFLLYANRSSALLKLLPLSRKTSRLHIEFERKEPHLLVDNFHAKPDFFYVFMFPQTSQAPGRMAMSMKVEILLRLSGLPFHILSNHFLLGSTSEGTAPFAQYNGHFLDTSAQIVEKVRNVLGERNYPHQWDSTFFKDDEKLIEFAEKFLYRILMYDRVKRQQSYYDSGPSSPKQIPKRWTGPGGLDFMLEDQAVREQMLPALPAAWFKDDLMEAEYDFEHELAEKLMRGAIVDWKWKNSLEAQLVAFVDSKLGHFIDEAKLFSNIKSKVMEKLEHFSKIMEKQPTLADISLFAVLIQFLEGPPLNMPNFRRLFADTPIDIESSLTAGETLADNDELIEEGKIRDVLRDYVKWGKRTFLEMSEEMNFEQSEKQQGDKFHGPYHIETDDLAGLEEVIDFETVDPTAIISVTTMEQLADNREAMIAKLKECKLLPSTPEHDANRSPSTSSTVNHRNEVLPAVVQSLLKHVLTRWSSAEERKFFGRLMLHQAGAFLCGLGTENANNEDKGKSKKGKEKGKEKAEDQVNLLHGEKSDMDEEPQVAKTCQEAHLLAVEKLVAQLAAKGGIRFDELAQEAKRLTYTAVVEHIDGLVAQKVRYAIDASAAVSLAKKIGSGGIEK